MDKLRAELPSGYLIEVVSKSRHVGKVQLMRVCHCGCDDITDDSAEESVSGNDLTAPLGLIGVVLFLLLFNLVLWPC